MPQQQPPDVSQPMEVEVTNPPITPAPVYDQSSILFILDSIRNAMAAQAMVSAERDRIREATIIKEVQAAGFETLQKMALEFTKSQQLANDLVNRLLGRLNPMAEDAGKAANEIKKAMAKKRAKPLPDVEAETSSKKKPPPPPPAAAIKAIEKAAMDGIKKGISEGAESSEGDMGTQAYIKGLEEATKSALEAADKANVSKQQAESILAQMNKYVQQLVIESVVAIKNSKRALSPVPKTNLESPEIKQGKEKKKKYISTTPAPAPAPPAIVTPPRAQSVTPQPRTRSRSAKRAHSTEPYKPLRAHLIDYSQIYPQ